MNRPSPEIGWFCHGLFAPCLALAAACAAAGLARGEVFVFETRAARLTISSDGIGAGLNDKRTGKERLLPASLAFAAVGRSGQTFPASAVVRRGDVLHVTFGPSGVNADYRVTATPEYIVVELTAFHGENVDEIRLMQLNVPLKNAGAPLSLRWDDDFAVALVGLSAKVDSGIAGNVVWAAVHPGFSTEGARVAIVAVPTADFLGEIRKVEGDFQLPSPMIGGTWAKRSEAVRTSYLFTDLTEANADETLRYAKLGGFHYVLIYAWAWSASLGSYPIHPGNFSHGEAGLKATIDKFHAAGLKVGMHMLTSFVGKSDPLVRPKPNPGLLKDAGAPLASDVSEAAIELTAAGTLAGFPVAGPYGPATDIQIDDEILHFGGIEGTKFVRCIRGFAGTKPAAHKAGTRIYHLAEREGSYVADIRTSLKDSISDRVAGLIDRCGFDMIYFDGGEINSAIAPGWYWMAAQQTQILERSKRELLVQGSGITGWTWHFFSRVTCDDASAVAVKPYLDYHKIADSWQSYHDDFLPADLGWAGIFEDGPDRSATTPDEVESYAVRMLALDSAVSFETTLNAIRANGRAEEMFGLLGGYEKLRLGGAVSSDMRKRLATGEWHMTRPGEFHPIRYDPQRLNIPGEATVRNSFPAQSLKFRLRAAPVLAAVGDPSNLTLFRSAPALEIQPPDSKAVLPGSLVRRFAFTSEIEDPAGGLTVAPRISGGGARRGPLDLRKHRALAVQVVVEGSGPLSDPAPVLNLQLEDGAKGYRDYYVDLDFSGSKTFVLAEPGTERTLADFRPAAVNYPFKAAMAGFNYANVVALNLRWMRYSGGPGKRFRLGLVEALEERDSPLSGVQVSAGASGIAVPGTLKTGDYAEYWGDRTIRVFDRNGNLLSASRVGLGPRIGTGETRLAIKASGSGTVLLTPITLGN